MQSSIPVAGTIILVEDEVSTRALLSAYLRTEGFKIVDVGNGEAFWRAFDSHDADLVILDINLPDTDGLSLARQIRARSDAGIIFSTVRNDDIDRVLGLEVGGDDYVTKPLNLRELLARIRAVLRRRSVAQQLVNRTVRKLGPWYVDLTRREITDEHGVPLRLTRGEFDLLAAMVAAGCRPVSRDYLLDVVSQRSAEIGERSVDTIISRLRRKLESDRTKPQLIVTRHGYGYQLGMPPR